MEENNENRRVYDWKIVIMTILSTLLVMIDYYQPSVLPWNKLIPAWSTTGVSIKVLDRTVLFFVIPLLIILLLFRKNPGMYGLRLGNWKLGILFTLAGMVIIYPILWIIVRKSVAIQEYYSPQINGLPWSTFLDLLGWEFMFRGWLLFGYARKFGPDALWLQAVPFAIAHLGKPELETLSTIFGGFAFGWIGWKTKSFLYPFLLHWFVATSVIVLAAGYHG